MDIDAKTWSAMEIRDAVAAGRTSVNEVAQRCLDRIAAREAFVQAWAWLDPDTVLQEAARLDRMVREDAPLGPLHGVPVGIKDIIDTAGIPTENGCAFDKGRVPEKDAWIVAQLRSAGALIFGKTVTTELAFLHPSKTRNPRNLAHTPGGSSAGSAAAVADGMIPLALGTQTGGSVIRPASFCGVVGLKPSFDLLPTDGVLVQSPSLDTLGVFANDLDDAALITSVLAAGVGQPPLEDWVGDPVFGWTELPGWDRADPLTRDSFAKLRTFLSGRIVERKLAPIFATAAEQRATINAFEMANHFDRYYGEDGSLLGAETRDAIAQGRALSKQAYKDALDYRDALRAETPRLFEGCDVLICPAALGPAPATLASTGDSIFNGLWTMTGEPTVTLPLISASDGLSIGVQLVAPRKGEDQLLKAARWLWQNRASLAP